MTYTLFPSMGFSICALVFLALVGFMYLSKKKFKNIENNIYAFMLVLTIVLLILEIVCVYTIHIKSQIPVLNEVLCRGYILGSLVWVILFIIYVLSLGQKNKKVQENITLLFLRFLF